jgi:hypothetical protein
MALDPESQVSQEPAHVEPSSKQQSWRGKIQPWA